jgi:hypothetical protein
MIGQITVGDNELKDITIFSQGTRNFENPNQLRTLILQLCHAQLLTSSPIRVLLQVGSMKMLLQKISPRSLQLITTLFAQLVQFDGDSMNGGQQNESEWRRLQLFVLRLPTCSIWISLTILSYDLCSRRGIQLERLLLNEFVKLKDVKGGWQFGSVQRLIKSFGIL